LDPLKHPDLQQLGRRLRDQMDETLDAEQAAARAAAARRRSLRDVLLEAEDRGTDALVSCVDGQLFRGQIEAVGTDHVVIETDGADHYIAMEHIVGVRVD